MKIAEVKKELSYLLETSIKSAKDLRLATTTDSKLAEVMKAWSFLNYTEEYSWNVLLDKLVADTSLINKAKNYLVTNWDVKESDLIVGRTYIEIKHGYQLTAVIHLTSSGDLTCASFTGNELFEDLMMLIEIVQGEGVNESLGEISGGGTVAPINQDEVNSSDTLVNYQILPLQTKFSHYSYFTLDTQLTYMRFVNEFHPVQVDLESKSVKDLVTQETHLFDDMFFTAFYGSPCNIQETETTSTIVATETSISVTTFKGIPIEHVTKYDIGLDYPETINDILLTKFPTYWLVNKSDEVLQFSSLANAVKHIKQWGGVNTVKVPSTEESLTPKIKLFAKFTEYTFLMRCYLDLITHFSIPDIKLDLQEASHDLYCSWCSLTAICFKRYVLMPTKHIDVHTKLLLIHLEATTGYVSTMAYYSRLDTKSIYA